VCGTHGAEELEYPGLNNVRGRVAPYFDLRDNFSIRFVSMFEIDVVAVVL
jgi:hypothetical protein